MEDQGLNTGWGFRTHEYMLAVSYRQRQVSLSLPRQNEATDDKRPGMTRQGEKSCRSMPSRTAPYRGAANNSTLSRRQHIQQNELRRGLRDFEQSRKSHRPPTKSIGTFCG